MHLLNVIITIFSITVITHLVEQQKGHFLNLEEVKDFEKLAMTLNLYINKSEFLAH